MAQLALEEVSALSEDNIKLRVKFSKHGLMKYIGHLDVMRYFQKLIRRCGLDIAYSAGYSPHQIMSFAQPLGVGLESDGEYMDIEVHSAESSEKVMEMMNSTQAEGMWVTDVVRLGDGIGNAMASVAQAEYNVRIRPGKEPAFDMKEAIDWFNSSEEVIIEKKTKKSTREVNLKELVYKLESCEDGSVQMRLCAGSGSNIKPGLLYNAIYEHYGVGECGPTDLLITRCDIFDENGKPLIEAGEHF